MNRILASFFLLFTASVTFASEVYLSPGESIFIDTQRVYCGVERPRKDRLLPYCTCEDRNGSFGNTVLLAYTRNLTTGLLVVDGRDIAQFSRNGADGRTACENAKNESPRCNGGEFEANGKTLSYCACTDSGGGFGVTTLQSYIEELETGKLLSDSAISTFSRNGSNGRAHCLAALENNPVCQAH